MAAEPQGENQTREPTVRGISGGDRLPVTDFYWNSWNCTLFILKQNAKIFTDLL